MITGKSMGDFPCLYHEDFQKFNRILKSITDSHDEITLYGAWRHQPEMTNDFLVKFDVGTPPHSFVEYAGDLNSKSDVLFLGCTVALHLIWFAWSHTICYGELVSLAKV